MTWDKDVADNSFPAGDFTIQQGDTVHWTHRGSNLHTITGDDGEFDSHPNCPPVCLIAGQDYSFAFEDVAVIDYHCKIHPSMTGTITVLEEFDGEP